MMINLLNHNFIKFGIVFLLGNLFTLVFIKMISSEKFCKPKFTVKTTTPNVLVGDWANSIQSLVKEDQSRQNLFISNLNASSPIESIREHFYHVVNLPLQTYCKVGKFFGGKWIGDIGCTDGHKFVCLDTLYDQIQNGTCLIYSFGIAGDWTFEEALASLGCQIRAFDPTIAVNTKPPSDRISYKNIGLFHATENKPGVGQVTTLKEAVSGFGDQGRTISYLKVDIEGSELKAISEWIKSGILENVEQIGIELHTGKGIVNDSDLAVTLIELLQNFSDMFSKGFRHISTTSNDCVGKSQDPQNKYVNLFEMAFYKPTQPKI